MLTQQDIDQFVNLHLLPYHVHGVLIVGSYARGYSLDQSDVDIMVFYETPAGFTAHSTYDLEHEGVSFTIEHHDIRQFIEYTLDHRFNIASLRMLLKVRDCVILQGDEQVHDLIRLARLAHLDNSVLLEALSRLIDELSTLRHSSSQYRRQALLRWTELISSLDLLCNAKRDAYSKPKWLYRSLKRNEMLEAVSTLDSLYVPTVNRIALSFQGVEQIINALDLSTLPQKDHRLFFNVTINDVKAMKTHFPFELGPPLRFLAATYYRFFCGVSDPLEHVASDRPFSIAGFEAIFERLNPPEYDEANSVRLFVGYITSLCMTLTAFFDERAKSDIGSVTFVPYFLSSYNAIYLMSNTYKNLEILPHLSGDRAGGHLTNLRRWLDDNA
jgi:hypothetical protein